MKGESGFIKNLFIISEHWLFFLLQVFSVLISFNQDIDSKTTDIF